MTKPTKPDVKFCGCGREIAQSFTEAVTYRIAGRESVIPGTNEWHSGNMCVDCEQDKAEREEAEAIVRAQKSRVNQINHLIDCAGFRAREREMLGHEATGTTRDAIASWVGGNKALYIHGGVGTGKTRFAVMALRDYIHRHLQYAKFRPVANLISDLRHAVMNGGDSQIIEQMINCPALILDDIAVERPTGYVLEAMYLIMDGWYASMRPHLIITSNLSLSQLAERLDDRLASRLSAMCEVVEFTGKDRRLGK